MEQKAKERRCSRSSVGGFKIDVRSPHPLSSLTPSSSSQRDISAPTDPAIASFLMDRQPNSLAYT
ncbi:MAG: hypothetical protein ACREP9_00825 [Candidatus Dormibacteraceae bacterium]